MPTYTQSYVAADAPRIYGALWAGAWFVLLIACANLTNLTLVRTIGRWREFSTRVALGAGQIRMVRQMLIESLVLRRGDGDRLVDHELECEEMGGLHRLSLPGARLLHHASRRWPI